jgi:hypothetical protein
LFDTIVQVLPNLSLDIFDNSNPAAVIAVQIALFAYALAN